MGLAVSTLRYMYLNSQRMDLEFKIMLITQSKTSLLASMSDLQNIGSDMDENSPVGKQLKQRQERLHLLEKKLTLQAEMYMGRLKMIEKEKFEVLYKDVAEIEEEIMKMQATVLVIQDVLSQYADVSDNNYNEIINSLDALSGKKVYVKGTSYHLEGEEGFTPTGKEDIYICDDAWIEMYKYSAAQYLGKDGKIITEFLSSAAEKSEYVEILVNPLLAATYVGIGEYDKAEALLPKIQEANKENIDYYMVQSMLYRYRDKDYQKGVDTCIDGLNMLARIPDGSDMIAQIGYILSMQKTLNYIMLEDYKSAYTSAEECYSYQAETYSISVQVRDLYAMLALETGDTETYKTLEEEIEEYGDAESGFSQDVKDYKDGKVTLQELAQSGGYDLL